MRLLTLILSIIFFEFIFSSPVWATEATLTCIPSTGTYKVGESFDIELVLDTRNFEVFGANLQATYDGDIIQATNTQLEAVTAVTLWGVPTTNTINSSTASISLDYGNGQPSYKGSTTIGKATFKGVSAGQAQLNYNFFQQYDDTTPGVAKVWGKKNGIDLSNILTDVNNCIYVIEAVTASPTPTSLPIGTLPTGAPSNTPSPTISVIPPLGGQNMTVSFLGMAAILVGAGIFLPVILNKREN